MAFVPVRDLVRRLVYLGDMGLGTVPVQRCDIYLPSMIAAGVPVEISKLIIKVPV